MTARRKRAVNARLAANRQPAIRLVCGCGDPDWLACSPGTAEQLYADDGHVLLLIPVPAVPARVWCARCWPWPGGVASPRKPPPTVATSSSSHALGSTLAGVLF
jgi:hypothetical protein